MKLIVTLLSCLFIGWATTDVQNTDNLFSRVDEVFEQQEPAWKIERQYPSNTSDPVSHNVVYRSKMGQASIEISVWKKEQDARDVFVGQVIAFDNTAGKNKLKRSLPNVGDENFIWTNPSSTGWPTIMIRKARILVHVFAPNVSIAKRFAGHVLKQIDAS